MWKRIVAATCVCAMFFGSSYTYRAKAATTDIPSVSISGTLNENDKVSSYLNGNWQNAMYRYEVGKTSSVEVELSVSTTLDNLKVRIMNSSTETLFEESVSKTQNSATGTWEKKVCLDPGVYYIYIMYTGKDYGSFTLSSNTTKLYNQDLTTDDSLKDARSVAVNSTYTGVLAWKEKNDFYRFEMAQNGKLTCKFDYFLPACKIDILDSKGAVLETESLTWTEKLGAGAIELETALMKGTYYLQISNANEKSSGKYVFHLQYTAVSIDETEPNNDILNAETIAIGSSKKGMLTAKDEVDTYKIQVPSTRRVTFTVNSDLEKFSWELYDKQYKQLKTVSATGTAKTEEKAAVGAKMSETYNLKAGVYYFQIRNDKTGVYTVKAANMTKPAKSSVTKLTRKKTTTTGWNSTQTTYSMQVTCKKAAGVAGYEIQAATNKKFSNKGVSEVTTPSTAFTVNPNKRYYVRVRTYKLDSDGGKVYSAYSAIKSYYVKK